MKIELCALKRGWKHLEEQYTFGDGVAFIDEQKETFDSTCFGFLVFPKGQKISEAIFLDFKSSKKYGKNFPDFCLALVRAI